MRILYATQWFEPEPILKGAYFAKLLRAHGHDVHVVTGFPNYPGGRLYPGYRLKWLRRDIMDDVPIDRVPLYPSHSRSALGRILNYVSFAAALTVYGLFTRKRPDVIYAYHPPLTVGLAAAIIAAVRRISFVYDIQDLWPDTVAASGMVSSRVTLRLVAALCRRVYARADRIIVQSPGFKRILIERGIPAGRIEVVYNWANELEARARHDSDLSAFALAGRFNVVYAGSMGPTQGLDTVLRAAKLIEKSEPRVQIILVGGGIEVDRLRTLAAEIGTTSLKIMPRVPQSEIGNLLAAADLLLVHLKDEPLFRITIPSKTQFYLAMGKPILMGIRGDAAELIERAGAGVIVEPQNADALAAAVLDLARRPRHELAAMGARGRDFYARELSAAVGVGRTLAVLDLAVAGRSRGSILKRAFDVAVSAAALVVLSPAILLTAAMLRLDLGSPVMFPQTRAGLDGKPFRLYKLRTMRDARDESGHPLPDGERLTPLTRRVRRLSLDELPQLLNVLRGDMSLVGPRPLLMAYLDRYTPEQARRHEVRPGITGWAQVNGRNAISWDEKLNFDTWYVKNRSFALDVKILAMTVVQVIRGRGISADGHETMFEFRGTLDSRNDPGKPNNS
jgi:lipopolysaccharide/colanic/teichoic acid biosynthesis glycosyltransferase/glycosyltransferase involved in cell wall biosynthesis